MITTPITADLLRGAIDLERTEHGLLPHRLPAWARAQTSDGLLSMVEVQPSGVRLVFRTPATIIELDTLPTKRVFDRARRRPAAARCGCTTAVRSATARTPPARPAPGPRSPGPAWT